MTWRVSVQRVYRGRLHVPAQATLARWARAALAAVADQLPAPADGLNVRVVGGEEMRRLNERYRDRHQLTDVLAFAADLHPEYGMRSLGDIVLCAPGVHAKAAQRGRPRMAHWAHLTVHASLHLCGFCHANAAEAERMEALETAILADLGYSDPYAAVSPPLNGEL